MHLETFINNISRYIFGKDLQMTSMGVTRCNFHRNMILSRMLSSEYI